jgi:uncharacterized protein YgiM (DUF1202 family)
MSYVECPECGQKALSVATRCPRCGYNYPPQPIHRRGSESELARLRPLLPIASIIVAGVVLVVVIARWAGSATSVAPSAGAPVDTVPTAGSAREVQPTPVAAADSEVSAVAVAPAPPGAPVKRYARTWVNVRGGRTLDTPSIRVLNPGEAVTVDSLSRGWYRVLAGGRTLGYVHRSALDTAPASRRP